MGLIRGMFLVAMVAISAVACTKDRTLEEYQNEDTLNKLAKLQSVQGVYTGLLKSQKNQPVGGVEIHLKAQLATGGGTGGGSGGGSGAGGGSSTDTSRAILTTELHFRDSFTTVTLRTQSGYFDINTGVYQADIPVPVRGPDGKVQVDRTVSVTGNISGGHIRGSMQGVGFSSQVTTFDAQMNGLSLEELAKMSKPVPGSVPEADPHDFAGEVRWPPAPEEDCIPTAKKPCPIVRKQEAMVMTAFYPVNTPEEHFANIFLPDNLRVLSITLTYGVQGHITFSAANWDTDSGTVIGESVWSGSTTGNVTRHLICRKFFFVETRQPFTCQFWSDRTDMATMTFNPQKP